MKKTLTLTKNPQITLYSLPHLDLLTKTQL